MQKTGRNVAKILKNALGKAFGKSRKAKACLADVNQEIISTLSKKIKQSEQDFENGVYKERFIHIVYNTYVHKALD